MKRKRSTLEYWIYHPDISKHIKLHPPSFSNLKREIKTKKAAFKFAKHLGDIIGLENIEIHRILNTKNERYIIKVWVY